LRHRGEIAVFCGQNHRLLGQQPAGDNLQGEDESNDKQKNKIQEDCNNESLSRCIHQHADSKIPTDGLNTFRGSLSFTCFSQKEVQFKGRTFCAIVSSR